jgi:hypothetical protein
VHQVKLIDKAIELLQDIGWIQGTAWEPPRPEQGLRGGYCMTGAMDRATELLYAGNEFEGRRKRQIAYAMVAQAIGEQEKLAEEDVPDIPDWNDCYCKDADQAIEMFKYANEKADKYEAD